MSSPRRTADDSYFREEPRDVKMLVPILITVALAVMFIYDQWNTWRRGSVWRRAANTATIQRKDADRS